MRGNWTSGLGHIGRADIGKVHFLCGCVGNQADGVRRKRAEFDVLRIEIRTSNPDRRDCIDEEMVAAHERRGAG